MEDLPISIVERDDLCCLCFTGSARVEVATRLQGKLQMAPADENLFIDWVNAEHVDASVMQVLLAYRISLKEHGASLFAEKDNPRVREYLMLSGL